jgi:hypothetical protein
MMNSDGTVQSAVELANGRNGIPSGTFAANEQVGIYASGLGDVDGDGVPDVILARQTAPGGAYVILLNSDGTAKSTVKIQNGMNGVPAGFFTSSDQAGYKICGGTDMDGDGVPDVFIGNQSRLNVFLLLLNADGTVKRAINYRPGVNGIPGTPEFTALGKNWTGATPIGDVDGNGVQDIFIEVHWRITIWARASLRCSIRTSPSNARFA